jgi:hypothetical protein
MSARGEGHDDVIAGTNARDPGAHRLDDAGAFVPENQRQRDWILLVPRVRVGLADSGRHDPNEDLVRPKAIVQLQLFEAKGSSLLANDCGSNTRALACRVHGSRLLR